MADNKWTDEQRRAIGLKGRRILVSAAAGSGKTAVLVERIIRRILDPDDGISVDRLLVMTFTRAAASEMKERIRQRLAAALEEDITPETALRLREQIAILDSACIQTIDSFCMNVVQDHTDELDIDPGVRVAEDAELTLLKADVMEEMLGEYYEKADDKFISFVEAYGQGTAGTGIEDKIMQLSNFAKNTVDPEGWYAGLFDGDDTSRYTGYIFETMQTMILSCASSLENLIVLCNKDGGPKSYMKTLEADIEFIEQAGQARDYEELSALLRNHEWPAIGRKGKNDSEMLVELVKTGRNKNVKDRIKGWTAEYMRASLEGIRDEEELVRPCVEMLSELAREYDRRIAIAKRKKNLIDFNDLEHMALKALKCDEDLKLKFDEIYIDEYQDTNDIQEAIISELDRGRVFMVGDVKQSIYKFRQARPEIFMEKYARFEKDVGCGAGGDGEGCGDISYGDMAGDGAPDTVIGLTRNFRSRREILDSVNRLFRRIMTAPLGGVEYTDDAKLNFGAEYYPETENGTAYGTRMLLADMGKNDTDDGKNAAEAEMIAGRIRQLTDPDTGVLIWDKDKKEMRRAGLSDIVILLRSCNTVGDIYLNKLLENDIAAHCDTNRGYFDSLEVRTMAAVLTAIDNPRKDIYMAAFLRSPMVGMTDDDLSAWRKAPQSLSPDARAKFEKAGAMLERYRGMSRYMGMEELITRIYDETGYYDYASALPAGKVRRANLDRLRQMAAEYAATGYRGLFNFIRYIDNLKTYSSDFGEASVLGEHDEAVRIMSIHKSKGLEFPIVFLAGSDKKMNQQDSNQAILIDRDLGVGCVFVNSDRRYKKKTLKQMALRLKMRGDTLGEELRVLYVATTRAREMLYITGCISDEEKFVMSYNNAEYACSLHPGDPLDLSVLRSDAGYLHWITESGVAYGYELYVPGENEQHKAVKDMAGIRRFFAGLSADPADTAGYDEVFKYRYPCQADVDLPNKISITELKRRHMEENGSTDQVFRPTLGQQTRSSDPEWVNRPGIPTHFGSNAPGASAGSASADEENGSTVSNYYDYFKEEDVIKAARRGTIYHEVMEKLDFSHPQLTDLPECVKESDIRAFIDSETGQLFKAAQERSALHREHQFIMGVPADELGLAGSSEPVLVQGIIDAYIEGADGIMLVDYKTDRVADEKELTDRYDIQLRYYAMALEKMRNKPVTRKVIWSFALGRAIYL